MAGEAVEGTFSQKNGTLIAVYQLGGYVRELSPVVDHLRDRMGINADLHNTAHLMWPLSKENLITFLERKAGGKSWLTNIRITERGVEKARDLLGMPQVTVGKVHRARATSGRAAHAVGRDGTDFRRHADVAVGGPIEHIQKEHPLDSVPFVVLSDEEAAQYRQVSVEESQSSHNGTAIDEETAQNPSPEEVTEKTPEVPENRTEVTSTGADEPPFSAPSDTHTEYPVETARRHYLFNPEEFPSIAAVLAKRDKIARYQKAAELLGDDEPAMAIALLDTVKISPLEEEVIRLISGE